ncbi:MAG: hypothetical protein N2422_13030, partial [Rhodobacteraceae bacterium]|nr:hypothetical protein [Paracoccaceae bacterium]
MIRVKALRSGKEPQTAAERYESQPADAVPRGALAMMGALSALLVYLRSFLPSSLAPEGPAAPRPRDPGQDQAAAPAPDATGGEAALDAMFAADAPDGPAAAGMAASSSDGGGAYFHPVAQGGSARRIALPAGHLDMSVPANIDIPPAPVPPPRPILLDDTILFPGAADLPSLAPAGGRSGSGTDDHEAGNGVGTGQTGGSGAAPAGGGRIKDAGDDPIDPHGGPRPRGHAQDRPRDRKSGPAASVMPAGTGQGATLAIAMASLIGQTAGAEAAGQGGRHGATARPAGPPALSRRRASRPATARRRRRAPPAASPRRRTPPVPAR